MGCAAFTFLGIYIAATNRSNGWAVGASAALAAFLFFVASYLAWKEQHDALSKAEAELNAEADIRGTIWAKSDEQNPYSDQSRRGSILHYVCDCANHGRKSCQINQARLVFHPPNDRTSFESIDRFPFASTVAPGDQFRYQGQFLVDGVTSIELQQCRVEVYLMDSLRVEYRNTVTRADWDENRATIEILTDHLAELESSGRPEITVKVTTSKDGNFMFVLENSSPHVAVNISALEIQIPIPPRILDDHKKLHGVTGVPQSPTAPTVWVIKFDHVDSLINNSGWVTTLGYHIDGIGLLQQKDLQTVLRKSTDNIETSLPFVLAFSNLGEAKRTWHSHYQMVYSFLNKDRLILRHFGIGEVGKDPRICSYCRKAMGS